METAAGKANPPFVKAIKGFEGLEMSRDDGCLAGDGVCTMKESRQNPVIDLTVRRGE